MDMDMDMDKISPSMTTTLTHALVVSAATIHRLFGATQCVWGVPKFDATMVAPLLVATMTPQATMSISVPI